MNPYALTKPTIVLVGMAEMHRDLAPWDDPEVEIWGINEAYASRHLAKKADRDAPSVPFMRRWDRWFQMHPKWDYMRPGNFNHANHPLWMTNVVGPCGMCFGKGKVAITGAVCEECSGAGAYDPARDRRGEMGYPFPIYGLEEDASVPGSARYPIEEVVGMLGANAEHGRWFTNSFGYMMGLALLLGAREIRAYGFEMSSSTEYGEQKPNAAFWTGVCAGIGVRFAIPPGCTLLGARDRLYGYEKVPGFTKMHAEIYANALQTAMAKAQAELNQIRGAKKALTDKMAATRGQTNAGHNKMQKELQAMLGEELRRISQLNALFGAFQQMKRVQAEVSALSSVAEIGYMDQTGARHMINLAAFEAEARHNIESAVSAHEEKPLSMEELYGA